MGCQGCPALQRRRLIDIVRAGDVAPEKKVKKSKKQIAKDAAAAEAAAEAAAAAEAENAE